MFSSMAMKATLVAASAALFVAGCTTDPYTGERRLSRGALGAMVGCGAGGGIGALTNTSSGKQAGRNALIGCGIGALAGGAVGTYMDRQAAELRRDLASSGVQVRRVGDSIELIMPSDVTFRTNSAAIDAQFYDLLNDVSKVFRKFEKTLITVEGHTDTSGSRGYNQTLSQERANNVSAYLIDQGVIPARFYSIKGMGETQLLVPTGDSVHEARNRRVEIRIEPLTNS